MYSQRRLETTIDRCCPNTSCPLNRATDDKLIENKPDLCSFISAIIQLRALLITCAQPTDACYKLCLQWSLSTVPDDVLYLPLFKLDAPSFFFVVSEFIVI